ncbi:MAG: hypothetical protein QOJ19_2987 [Acidimicrobiia bacterium]|nr:hypothetical protein [Acidimicrobiia bacterium]
MTSELRDTPTEPVPGEQARLRIGSGVLDPAVMVSRAGRIDTMGALHALEDALAAPTPRRERTWLHRVLAALDVLGAMLDAQAAGDDETNSLLNEIRRDDPRFGPRVHRLRAEQADLRMAVTSLRDQLAPDAAAPVDTADIRDRLASIARRLRAQRARESDLVYEAVNIDLGVSD